MRNGRVDELERLHRFTHPWEAAASLLLRSGDPRAFDAYEAHGRIIAGTLEEHLARMADTWITNHQHGRPSALVASTNDHVDTINRAVQQARLDAGHLDADTAIQIAGGEHAHIGDVVATRRNDRRLTTTAGEPVRNRDTWTVTGIDGDGSLTVSHHGGHGDVTLPADYAREHVRLGYVATEHGWESDTVTAGMCLASPATTRRGLYVAVTRGSDENLICVITDSDDVAEARDVLDGIVAIDRADIPAVTQRRTLAQQLRDHDTPVPPPPTPRCVIPDWFTPLLHDARHDLAAAEERQAARAAQRQRLLDAIAAADRTLSDVAAATAPDRDATRTPPPAPTTPADTTPPPNAVSTPRHAEPVAAPDTTSTSPSADWNVPTPTSNGPGSGPNHQSSDTAWRRHSDATPTTTCAAVTLPICSTPCTTPSTSIANASPPSTHGSDGPPAVVSDNDSLRAAVDMLATVHGSDRPFNGALADSLRQWAIHNGVDLSAHTRPAPAIHRAGLELEL